MNSIPIAVQNLQVGKLSLIREQLSDRSSNSIKPEGHFAPVIVRNLEVFGKEQQNERENSIQRYLEKFLLNVPSDRKLESGAITLPLPADNHRLTKGKISNLSKKPSILPFDAFPTQTKQKVNDIRMNTSRLATFAYQYKQKHFIFNSIDAFFSHLIILLLEKQFNDRGQILNPERRTTIDDMVALIVLSGYHWIVNKQDLIDVFTKLPNQKNNMNTRPTSSSITEIESPGEKTVDDNEVDANNTAVHQNDEEGKITEMIERFNQKKSELKRKQLEDAKESFSLWEHFIPEGIQLTRTEIQEIISDFLEWIDQDQPKLQGNRGNQSRVPLVLPYLSFHHFRDWFSRRFDGFLKNAVLQRLRQDDQISAIHEKELREQEFVSIIREIPSLVSTDGFEFPSIYPTSTSPKTVLPPSIPLEHVDKDSQSPPPATINGTQTDTNNASFFVSPFKSASLSLGSDYSISSFAGSSPMRKAQISKKNLPGIDEKDSDDEDSNCDDMKEPESIDATSNDDFAGTVVGNIRSLSFLDSLHLIKEGEEEKRDALPLDNQAEN
jgi:hypothetical protein